MLEVYDDILDTDFILHYEAMHVNPHFGWYLSSNTYGTVDKELAENIKCPDTNIKEGPQFVHSFVVDSQDNSDKAMYARDCLDMLCSKIGITNNPFRIKSNLCPLINSNNSIDHQVPHVDTIDSHLTGLLYVNEADGPTYFFDNDYKVVKAITPKQGRFVLFDGDIFHAGSHPNTSPFRIVTNFNFTM